MRAISARGLRKSFGDKVVPAGIDLDVSAPDRSPRARVSLALTVRLVAQWRARPSSPGEPDHLKADSMDQEMWLRSTQAEPPVRSSEPASGEATDIR
jgi:hypothetical protein